MMTGNARAAALQVLQAMERSGAWADAALTSRIQRDRLSPQDAALATRLVYGVLQNRMLLDHWIGAYCSQKPDHLQVPLPDILRLGVYQIVFLDKIPDSAAVNESVKLAKQSGRAQASGLVNAVLRRVAQNKENLPEVPIDDTVKYLSITYSHPKWLVKRLVKLLGREEAEAFLQADNGVAPVTAQVNTLKTSGEALIEELTELGVDVRPHGWIPGCVEMVHPGNLTDMPPFQAGKFLVQDGAARLVTAAAAPRPGDRVIDVCAAPGGKSFSAAIAMGDRGSILSCDLHENKLKRIREGAQRLGLTCIETAAADGRAPHGEWTSSAELVLVDAPCSGLGIIRKKPEIRYKSANDIASLPVTQSAILENASTYVKPGGTLIYSTCTILPEENEQVTDAFLAEHPDFSRESFAFPDPVGETDGQVTLWPQRHGVDGFYICRMKRN
jgi:16S rRNA (cytosine967-C5)-methyltransferase